MKRMFDRKLITRQTIALTSPRHFPQLQAATLTEKKILSPRTIASKTAPMKVPNSHFFAKLKKEEHKQFLYRKRERFYYKENYSAALALPYTNNLLATKQKDQNALLTLSKENIIEHANRRVDLFFYTLIAYYKTAVFPTNGHTTMQHGRGRTTRSHTSITEACHSSLTPSLLDNTIYQNRNTGEKHKSLLSNTHFMDSLNSTVELPPFVNDFDDRLENMCRKKCMDILCDVSLGKINPIEGLNHFLNMMHDILKDLKEDAEHKSHSALSQYSLMRQQPINLNLIDLVITGTLSTTFSSEKRIAADAYIQLLLRITPKEKALCSEGKCKEKLYLEKIKEIQNEILKTKSDLLTL